MKTVNGDGSSGSINSSGWMPSSFQQQARSKARWIGTDKCCELKYQYRLGNAPVLMLLRISNFKRSNEATIRLLIVPVRPACQRCSPKRETRTSLEVLAAKKSKVNVVLLQAAFEHRGFLVLAHDAQYMGTAAVLCLA